MYYVIWYHSDDGTVIYDVEENPKQGDNIEFCGSYEDCTALAEAKNYHSEEFWDLELDSE